MLLKGETPNFLLWDFKNFKNEILQLAHAQDFYQPFDLKALLNTFSQMVSIISMNVNKTEISATKGFTMVHCRLWNMVHGSNVNW